MTYADDFNLRQAIATGDNIAAAVDGLLVAYSAQEHSTLISNAVTSTTIYTGSSITVTVPDGAIVEVLANVTISNGNATANNNMTIEQDGTDLVPISRWNSHRGDVSGVDITLHFSKIVAPAAGAHTYKIKWWPNTGTIYSARAYMLIKIFQNS
jgi:hypothetical protein